jgi:pimeloyl-ACP methyl ester carboxylesterase
VNATIALQHIALGDVDLEFLDRGTGTPLLVLHGAGGPVATAPFIDLLAERARVIAPTHPGFADAALPEWFDSIDDLAYLYLDLLQALDLRDAIVVGMSMGGWTAAEIAVRSTDRLAGLVLVDAVGIKVSDRETRDIADIFATPADVMTKLTFHDPSKAPNVLALPDDALERVARNRAASAMYLWEPYAHNPKLRRRLRRIDVPALVLWGESDRLVTPDYGRAFAASIPGAEFRIIPAAGHAPQLEQPHAFADHVLQFASDHAARPVH